MYTHTRTHARTHTHAHTHSDTLSLSLSIFVVFHRFTVENNKDITSVWRALNTFTEGTHSSQKEIPHHFTADAFNDYFLSIAETLVKSQDSPDSDK